VKEAALPGMSEQEIWDFLTEGTRTAHVATTRSDGRPHVKPVWFVLDGRPGDFQFLFTTYAESVKGRGLRRNTQVAASVDDPAPPYSFVIGCYPDRRPLHGRGSRRRVRGPQRRARRTADPADPGSDNCPAGSIRLILQPEIVIFCGLGDGVAA
jgi:hypothetical protein